MPHFHGSIPGAHVHGDGTWSAGAVAPTGNVTLCAVSGQTLSITVTLTNALSGTVSVAAGNPANGAQSVGPLPLVINGNAGSFTLNSITPGNYAAPVITLTGPGGSTGLSGLPFTILGIGGTAQAPNIGAAPSVTSQPADATAFEGGTANFTVVAAGATPFTYQWRRNGQSISGATDASYTTPALTLADNGAVYSCRVTNAAGQALSGNATLTVRAVILPPVITAQPVSQVLQEGSAATLVVTAIGTAPLAFQWRRNGQTIPGATQSTYITPALLLGDTGAAYTCVITNAAGTVTSAQAVITVTQYAPPPAPETIVRWMDMVPEMAMHLPDCPYPTIMAELLTTSREFFRITLAWREANRTLASTVANQGFYNALNLPEHRELTAMPSPFVGKTAAFESLRPGKEDEIICQVVGGFALSLLPAPTQSGLPIGGEVAYVPALTSPGLPASLWRSCGDAIKAGTWAGLMRQLGKPWTQPQLADMHGRRFDILAAKAAADAGHKATRPRFVVRSSPL